jgi:hypothetical protein
MSAPEEPLGVGWEAFFLLHALPHDEEAAFRGYLAAHAVPDDAGVHELDAHYGAFVTQWEPGIPPRSEAGPGQDPGAR